MCDALRHRGPDDDGYFVDDGVSLGVRRLSIIDLETGKQPVHNEDETVWVVFNGEIYNYIELREQLLLKGHKFYTRSDTEVLVHLYEDHGPDLVNWLRGMFAFAIWDRGRRRLLLARDRFGKKPLYYASINGDFFFASEAKAIVQYPEYIRRLNLNAIDYFLTYSYIPSPLTAFKGMSKLPPASLLLYDKGQTEVKSYWDLSFARTPKQNVESVLEELDRLLTEAVRIRLRSDVPLGAFLSGGIDSSTVVSIASRLMSSPVKTFSIGFEESDYNELPFARAVASQLQTEHHEAVLKPEVFRVLPILAWHYDEPFADASALPTYYVSEFARKHVKVVLTGDGGDEIFMGYPWMADPATNRIRRLKKRLRVLKNSSEDLLHSGRASTSSAQTAVASTVEARYLQRVSRIEGSELERAYAQDGKASRNLERTGDYLMRQFERARGLTGGPDTLSRLDYVTIKSYLPEDILVKVDRASMAVSLEPRCPLLDHVLCEFVAGLPSSQKMRDGETKIILRKYASKNGLIPQTVLNRGKMGFGVPLEKWFIQDLKPILENILLDSHSKTRRYFKESYLRTLLADRSSIPSSQKIFALVMFELWYRMFIEGDSQDRPSLDMYDYF